LRSDILFEDGEISCEFWLDSPTNKVQFRIGVTNTIVTFVGVNLQGGAYGIAQRDEASSNEKTLKRERLPFLIYQGSG
jgi:hypothetical protein